MKITKNFSKSEFDSKDGAIMPGEVLNNLKKFAAATLQPLRDEVGALIVNSGYRSPSHNASEGGASRSYHLYDRAGVGAADVRSPHHTPKELYAIAKRKMDAGEIPKGGLKAYRTFLHIDNRGHFATW